MVQPQTAEVDRILHLFVGAVSDYALVMLRPDGTVVSWNAGAQAIKGYAAAEIIGRNFAQFYPAADIAADKPRLALKRAADHGRYEDTGPRVRKDGTPFTANVVITAIRDEQGALVGFGKITRDVSVRAADDAQRDLREARLTTLVDTVLDTLVDGLIIIDRAGTVQVYNRACERLFGYSEDEVVGRNVKMLMTPEIRTEHDQYLRNYQQTGVRKIIGISREVVGQRKDGSTFPMHLAVGEAVHLGEPIYVGIIRDLTERDQVEAQLRQSQKMEAVGQLTGGLAHDFNNILMVIMANVDTLFDEPQTPQNRERLEQIDKATQRAADLTRQLLAYSRRQPLQPRLTSLNEMVASTSRLLRRTLGENVEIDAVLAPDLWLTNVDRTQLESTLVNLCLNARDAMPGGGRLAIETRNVVLDEDYTALNPDATAGPYAMLAVSDTGVGIPANALAKVFEPFFTTKEVGKGTGLGLSMVYGFIKQSLGHVKIYSELGRGTSIKLYLPRAIGAIVETVAEAAPSLPSGNERILVVEDDEQVRIRVVEMLRRLGYRVEAAPNGPAGLAAWKEASVPYDLLLTDVVMPGPMDGRALADAIGAVAPDKPVIFMSGYAPDAAFHQGQLDPSVRLLSKPFRQHELAQMVREALDEAREQPQPSR